MSEMIPVPFPIETYRKLLTPQEAGTLTSTERYGPIIFYQPRILGGRNRLATVEEVNQVRSAHNCYIIPGYLAGVIFGEENPNNLPLAMTIEGINPETGMTINDPQVLGFVAENRIPSDPKPDLTEKFYSVMERYAPLYRR